MASEVELERMVVRILGESNIPQIVSEVRTQLRRLEDESREHVARVRSMKQASSLEDVGRAATQSINSVRQLNAQIEELVRNQSQASLFQTNMTALGPMTSMQTGFVGLEVAEKAAVDFKAQLQEIEQVQHRLAMWNMDEAFVSDLPKVKLQDIKMELQEILDVQFRLQAAAKGYSLALPTLSQADVTNDIKAQNEAYREQMQIRNAMAAGSKELTGSILSEQDTAAIKNRRRGMYDIAEATVHQTAALMEQADAEAEAYSKMSHSEQIQARLAAQQKISAAGLEQLKLRIHATTSQLVELNATEATSYEHQRKLATARRDVSTQLSAQLAQYGSLTKSIAGTNQQMQMGHGITQKSNVIAMQLGYAIEDAAVSYGTSGMSGAIRGATNNLSAVGMMFGTVTGLTVVGTGAIINLMYALDKSSSVMKGLDADGKRFASMLSDIRVEAKLTVFELNKLSDIKGFKTEKEGEAFVDSSEKELERLKNDLAGNEQAADDLRVAMGRANEGVKIAKDELGKLGAKAHIPDWFKKLNNFTDVDVGKVVGSLPMAQATAALEEYEKELKAAQEDAVKNAKEAEEIDQKILIVEQAIAKAKKEQAELAERDARWKEAALDAAKRHKNAEDEIAQAAKDFQNTMEKFRIEQDDSKGWFKTDSIRDAKLEAQKLSVWIDQWKGMFNESEDSLNRINKEIDDLAKKGKEDLELNKQRNQLLINQANIAAVIAKFEAERAEAEMKALREKKLAGVGMSLLEDLDPEQKDANIRKAKEQAEDRRKAVEESFKAGEITKRQRDKFMKDIDTAETRNAYKKQFDQGKQLTESMLSPMEEFKKKKKELDEMFKLGAIEVETYNKSLRDAQFEMNKKYQINFEVTGVDAVRAGTKEAMLSWEKYKTGLMTPTPGLEDQSMKMMKLNNKDEKQFQDWYKKVSTKFNLDQNPDDPQHFYDYRGAWKSGFDPFKDPNFMKDQHWPSRFKQPGHPREFLPDEDGKMIDTKTGKPVEQTVSFVPDKGTSKVFDDIANHLKTLVNISSQQLGKDPIEFTSGSIA